MSEPATEKKASKSGGSLPMLILLVLNIGGTGFLAFRSFQAPKAAAAHAGEAAAAPKEEPGVVTGLEPFVVNLNEPGSSRYLKATFELELRGKAAYEELDKQKRAVRDDILRYLSSLTVADTLGETGKNKIQETIVARVDKQIGAGKVKRCFFTEFVVQ